MRNFAIAAGIGSILGTAALALTAPADTQPTTQACLGDLKTFLTCPAGMRLAGTECREDEQHHGAADGEHWSGSKRQGHAVFLRDDTERDPANWRISFAANYKDHKKQGRTFNFDKDGRLESWADMADDDYHGLAVDCLPDGRVSNVAYFKAGKVVGLSLHWKASDGSFSFAYDQSKRASVSVPPAMQVRPDRLCHPARCDVNAKPDLSGIPKA